MRAPDSVYRAIDIVNGEGAVRCIECQASIALTYSEALDLLVILHAYKCEARVNPECWQAAWLVDKVIEALVAAEPGCIPDYCYDEPIHGVLVGVA